MKFRGTLGGLNIQIGADDTPQSVQEPLSTRTALLESGVILEIDTEARLDTFDAVRRAIEEAGGEIKVLRAPRVNAPAPRPAEPAPAPERAEPGAAPAQLPAAPQAAEANITQSPITQSPITQSPITQSPITQSLDPEPVVVPHSLRAGFRGEYLGSVVVLGDVNPGTELVAGGDVIVLGALRGVVHAGADGREDAIVWARPIASAQIRIAGAVARAAQTSSMGNMKKLGAAAGQAETARLQGGQIVIERSHTPPVAR